MKVAIDPSGTAYLFIDDNIRKDLYGCWESTENISLIRKYKENGMFLQENLELDESLRGLTHEDEPVEVKIVPDENGNMWLCRNANGNLKLCCTEPQRNSVNPVWSAQHCVCVIDHSTSRTALFPNPKDEFEFLTWKDEPLRVKLVKA